MNGQAFSWMGVNLIPFIEENRIKRVVYLKRHLFNEEEIRRNALVEALAFFNTNTNILSKYIGNSYSVPYSVVPISIPNFSTFSGTLKHWEHTYSRQ